LATAAGAEAMMDEERYRRRPKEEQQYRADALAIATDLQSHPELIDPDVAEQLLGVTKDIGEGSNPERSTVAGRAMVRNVTIGIVSGSIGSAIFAYAPLTMGAAAFYVAHLAFSETIKKTRWFQSLTKFMASRVDDIVDEPSKEAAQTFRSTLDEHRHFVQESEPKLRRLAGSRREFGFLHSALDWLAEQKTGGQQPNQTDGPTGEIAPPQRPPIPAAGDDDREARIWRALTARPLHVFERTVLEILADNPPHDWLPFRVIQTRLAAHRLDGGSGQRAIGLLSARALENLPSEYWAGKLKPLEAFVERNAIQGQGIVYRLKSGEGRRAVERALGRL
jgi:hypothetical protein